MSSGKPEQTFGNVLKCCITFCNFTVLGSSRALNFRKPLEPSEPIASESVENDVPCMLGALQNHLYTRSYKSCSCLWISFYFWDVTWLEFVQAGFNPRPNSHTWFMGLINPCSSNTFPEIAAWKIRVFMGYFVPKLLDLFAKRLLITAVNLF